MIKVNELYEISICENNNHVWDVLWVTGITLFEDIKTSNIDYIDNTKQEITLFPSPEQILICRKCHRIKLYNHQIKMFIFADQQLDTGEDDLSLFNLPNEKE